VPEISRFFGIVVAMYYDDHQPPHFHARYGRHRAMIAIDSLAVLSGSLPPRVYGLVVEWGSGHREELSANWERARRHLPLDRVRPLE
jgi:hypothetical protein